MTRIIGIMPLDITQPLVFYRKSNDGFVVATEVDVSNSDDLIVLVPSTEIALHVVNLPTRNEAEARRAAAFAIEDELSVATDTLHIALSKKQAGTYQREVHAVSVEVIEAWIKRLEASKFLSGAQLVADVSMLPDRSVAIDLEDRVLASANKRKFAIDGQMPGEVLSALISAGDDQVEILGERLAARLRAASWESIDPTQKLLEWAHKKTDITNLRQGKFATRKPSKLAWSDWKLPVGLAAATAMAWVTTLGLEGRALNGLTENMTNRAQAIYKVANPGEPVPRNLAQSVQVTDQESLTLDARRAVAILYSGLQSIEGARLQSVRYDQSNQSVRARILYQIFGDDVKLKSHLEEQGIDVRTGDVRQQGEWVSGEITMRLGS